MHNPATDLDPAGGELDESSPDSSGGYRICLDCLPNGTYRVSRQPLAPEGPADTGGQPMSQGASYPSFEKAIEAVAAIVQENPMGETTEQAGFEAVYPPPEKGPMKPSMKPGRPMPE
jgi:hypothetical protein